MIVSFRHKGLKRLYERGDESKLQPKHIRRVKMILSRLESVKALHELDVPGYRFHKLSGELQTFWSIRVDENYRVIFRIEGQNVYDIDYLDYH